MHIGAGGEFLMCHQVITGLGRNRHRRIALLHLHSRDLRCRLPAYLQGKPGDQGQSHHRSGGGKSELTNTSGGSILGCNYGGFCLQSFVEVSAEALADLVGLSQGISDEMIGRPIPLVIMMAFEFIKKRVRLILEHLAVHQCRNFLFHSHHLLSSVVPNNGRKLAAIASRALNIRDRTVPIGQSITAAISS